jgi:hypothetical protein
MTQVVHVESLVEKVALGQVSPANSHPTTYTLSVISQPLKTEEQRGLGHSPQRIKGDIRKSKSPSLNESGPSL